MYWLMNAWADFQRKFYVCFIKEDRWKMMLEGLGITLKITFFALIVGLIIGICVALVRSTWDRNGKAMHKGWRKLLLRVANRISVIYVTVMRGTPVMVQLLIWYFVILVASNNKQLVAICAFGINSGAYVAEIFRAGIMSIDYGQTEAGRSLGFNYVQTMRYIILPQAVKNVLPTLCNEFIALLKETSICGYIGLAELTRAGDIIRGRTYIAFLPLFAVAIGYLVMVIILTWLIGKLERRLRASDVR